MMPAWATTKDRAVAEDETEDETAGQVIHHGRHHSQGRQVRQGNGIQLLQIVKVVGRSSRGRIKQNGSIRGHKE